MKQRSLLFSAFLILLLLFSSGCRSFQASDKADPSVLYSSGDVSVTVVDESAFPTDTITEYEWTALTEEEAVKTHSVILTGVVSNVRACELKYRFMDADCNSGITVFDVAVEDLLFCNSDSVKNKGTISVGTGYNLGSYDPLLPPIEEGGRYLMFLEVPADYSEDPAGLAGFLDCWVGKPKDLMWPRIDDCCLVCGTFSDSCNAINVSSALGLSELDVYKLSALDPNDEAGVSEYVDKLVKERFSGDPDKADTIGRALLSILKRTESRKGSLAEYVDEFAVIDASALEEYVVGLALENNNVT